MTKDVQGQARSIHPGSGRRKAPLVPKGREPEAGAVARVQEILGDRPRARDLLIEHLHLIQDAEGCLSAAHLQALAGEHSISMAEVYEVASFYAHFDIVLDGEERPAPVTIRVCDSLSCAMAGAEALLANLPGALGDGVRVVRAPCMGRCDLAPVAEVGHRHVDHATTDSLKGVVESGDHKAQIPAYEDLAAYKAGGGYQLLEACRDGTRSAEEVIEALEQSGLKGKGGAGFPSGLKWKLVRQQPGPRLFAINADEGEPGTFKDRFYLETAPHRFLEGMLIGRLGCREPRPCYIYLRDEYPAFARDPALRVEIAAARRRPAWTGGIAASSCGAAPAPTSAAKSRPCSNRSRASGACRATSRPSPSERRPVRSAHPDPQRGDPLLGARHRRARRRTGSPTKGRPRAQGPALLFGLGPGQGAGA